MTLDPGAKLGRYEILSRIGEGGMGEVYLAEDPRLRRKVALKVLSGELAAHKDRIRRFEQEAQAAAALNHPNIAHIYEVDDSDGTTFIAMEYVDGLTLRKLIHDRQTELAKLLRYLQHVAEGLAKAHVAGIVHRDLKPDNIMVTREGHAKILDFGLAKLTERQREGAIGRVGDEQSTIALSPNHPLALSPEVITSPGVIMGTVGYMSPEQAQGRIDEIDHRSDIFSFGCILYEAITRRKAFEGKDAIDSLNQIIREQPKPIATFAADASHDLQRVVRRCLAKDPDERYQTIKDVAIEIKEVRRELQSRPAVDSIPSPNSSSSGDTAINQTQSPSTSLSPPAVNTHPSSAEFIATQVAKHKTAFAFMAVALVVVIVAGVYAFMRFGAIKPSNKSGGMKISRIMSGGDGLGGISISPDGKYIAYLYYKEDSVSVHVRQISTGGDREIVPPVKGGGSNGTVFSPDNELVYYTLNHAEKSPNGTLYQVPVIGGREPKKIVENIASVVSFAPDGKRFVFLRTFDKSGESALMIGSIDGGEVREIGRRRGNDWFDGVPAWSPDGKVIAFVAATDTGGTQFSMSTIPVDGGPEKPIGSYKWHGGISRPTWLHDGTGLFINAREEAGSPTQIWQLAYPDGVVTRVTSDLTDYGSASFGLTADDSTIATIAGDRPSKIWVASNDERGRQITNGRFDAKNGLDWTPDGRIVFSARNADTSDIWSINHDGTAQQQLTSNPDLEDSMRVSPDGRSVVFTSSRAGALRHVWRMGIDGSNLKQLTDGEFLDFSPAWSHDGQWIFFNSWRTGSNRIWKVPANGGTAQQVNDLAASSFRFVGTNLLFCRYYDEQVSPARWRLALVSSENGQLVKVFDPPPTASGFDIIDEKTFVYNETKGDIGNLWSRAIDGGPAKQLTKFESERIFSFSISPDGKQFAVARGLSNADIVLIKDFR